jgi:two-component system chemotaxis response regulator CheY
MSVFFNKILIVDDFQSMRNIIKDSIKDLSINFYLEASGGKEALDKIMKSVEDGEPVDLILCDWNMPLFSGLDLLKLIRNTPETQNIPFIMITAENEREKVIDALKSGANDYIIKPLSADVVIRKLINIKKKQQNR